jgi:FdhE protein
MTGSRWDRRIRRAEELADVCPPAAEILRFYAGIARFQKTLDDELRAPPPIPDVFILQPRVSPLLSLVKRIGPAYLARRAEELAQDPTPWETLLAGLGHAEVEKDFFARCLLQPYYEYLAGRSVIAAHAVGPDCPACGHKPVAAVLRGEGDGAKRSLACSLCSTEWEFRRLLCPNCAEENERKLPVYTAEEFPHVRIEACDTCRTYIKSVDLTRNGLAVPEVDELATVSLSLWAEEHGYAKLQLNLLGM